MIQLIRIVLMWQNHANVGSNNGRVICVYLSLNIYVMIKTKRDW